MLLLLLLSFTRALIKLMKLFPPAPSLFVSLPLWLRHLWQLPLLPLPFALSFFLSFFRCVSGAFWLRDSFHFCQLRVWNYNNSSNNGTCGAPTRLERERGREWGRERVCAGRGANRRGDCIVRFNFHWLPVDNATTTTTTAAQTFWHCCCSRCRSYRCAPVSVCVYTLTSKYTQSPSLSLSPSCMHLRQLFSAQKFHLLSIWKYLHTLKILKCLES